MFVNPWLVEFNPQKTPHLPAQQQSTSPSKPVGVKPNPQIALQRGSAAGMDYLLAAPTGNRRSRARALNCCFHGKFASKGIDVRGLVARVNSPDSFYARPTEGTRHTSPKSIATDTLRVRILKAHHNPQFARLHTRIHHIGHSVRANTNLNRRRPKGGNV